MAFSLTLAQIRNEVRGYLMNVDSLQAGWSDTELNTYINEGVFYIQQIAEYFWDFGVAETILNQRDYAAPDNQYQFIRLTFSQEFLPQTTEYELDRDTNSSWRGNPTGTPARFYMSQHNQVSLYPVPNANGPSYSASPETGEALYFTLADGVTRDSTFFTPFSQETGCICQLGNNAGQSIIKFKADALNRFNSPDYGIVVGYQNDLNNLGFMYLAMPDTMTDDAHIPQIQETGQPAIVYYTLMRCFARDGEFQDLELAGAWWQAFMDWMESALQVQAWEFPQRVKSAEPFQQGNILQGRLQAVGPPSQLIVIGSG